MCCAGKVDFEIAVLVRRAWREANEEAGLKTVDEARRSRFQAD